MSLPTEFFRRTPWGAAQSVREIAAGIWSVGTPSHGGIYLEPERLQHIPAGHKAYAARWSHGFGPAWFEEDCAVACVVVAFPEHFSEANVTAARRVVAEYIDAKATA